jgi:hypothetical protein
LPPTFDLSGIKIFGGVERVTFDPRIIFFSHFSLAQHLDYSNCLMFGVLYSEEYSALTFEKTKRVTKIEGISSGTNLNSHSGKL